MISDNRLPRRSVLALLGGFALAGCASRGGGSVEAEALSERFPDATATVLAVTNRKPVGAAEAAPWFDWTRSGGTRAVRVALSNRGGSIVGRAVHAVFGGWRVLGVESLGPTDPVAALVGAVGAGDVLLYVHGYKTSFETSILDARQLGAGARFAGRTVAFSWPSRDALIDYGYDRESALWSRDALQDLLEALARNPSGGRIHIVAHSMGALLTLETLRQLWAASGSGDLAARIGAVVLAAPDIDVDLFAASLVKVGPLSRHMTVIISTRDRALAVSGQLAGGVSRVGASVREQIEPLGVKVVDASDYGWGVIGHDVFLSNDDVRNVIRRAIERGANAGP